MRASTRRGLEWSLLLLIILSAAGFYVREFRLVQAQGEVAAVKTTLGALRTALLIDHLKSLVDGTAGTAAVQRNPFLLLDHAPVNYAGVLAGGAARVLQPGTWVFDSICSCIGYEPLYPQDLSTPVDAPGLWWRVSTEAPPLQIHALQRYVWLGQVLD